MAHPNSSSREGSVGGDDRRLPGEPLLLEEENADDVLSDDPEGRVGAAESPSSARIRTAMLTDDIARPAERAALPSPASDLSTSVSASSSPALKTQTSSEKRPQSQLVHSCDVCGANLGEDEVSVCKCSHKKADHIQGATFREMIQPVSSSIYHPESEEAKGTKSLVLVESSTTGNVMINIKVNGDKPEPCDAFEVDDQAKEYGSCKCGANKATHSEAALKNILHHNVRTSDTLGVESNQIFANRTGATGLKPVPKQQSIGHVTKEDLVPGEQLDDNRTRFVGEEVVDPAVVDPLRLYRALYDFERQDVDDLMEGYLWFPANALIEVLEMLDEGWMMGRIHGTEAKGVFPENYVIKLDYESAIPAPANEENRTTDVMPNHEEDSTVEAQIHELDISDPVSPWKEDSSAATQELDDEEQVACELVIEESVPEYDDSLEPRTLEVSETGDRHPEYAVPGRYQEAQNEQIVVEEEKSLATGEEPASWEELPLVEDHAAEDSGTPFMACALFAFSGESEEHLSFNVGAVIKVLAIIDSEWWRGELNGEEGVFPADYVFPDVPVVVAQAMELDDDFVLQKISEGIVSRRAATLRDFGSMVSRQDKVIGVDCACFPTETWQLEIRDPAANLKKANSEFLRALVFIGCQKPKENVLKFLLATLNATPNLVSMVIQNCETPSIVKALSQVIASSSKTLENIDLSGTLIGEADDASLTEFFCTAQASASLRRLSLASTGLCRGAYLNRWTSAANLISLNLSNNVDVGDAVADTVGNLLTTSGSLRTVKLSNCGIGTAGATRLALGITSNRSLRFLDLSHNFLDDSIATEFGSIIGENHCVTSLNLSSNQIADAGVHALLKIFKGLQQLDLTSNRIGNDGARSISMLMAESRILTSLVLTNNSISDRGSSALAWAVRQNISLDKFHVDGNPIPQDMKKKMVSNYLSSEATLSEFNVDGQRQFGLDLRQEKTIEVSRNPLGWDSRARYELVPDKFKREIKRLRHIRDTAGGEIIDWDREVKRVREEERDDEHQPILVWPLAKANRYSESSFLDSITVNVLGAKGCGKSAFIEAMISGQRQAPPATSPKARSSDMFDSSASWGTTRVVPRLARGIDVRVVFNEINDIDSPAVANVILRKRALAIVLIDLNSLGQGVDKIHWPQANILVFLDKLKTLSPSPFASFGGRPKKQLGAPWPSTVQFLLVCTKMDLDPSRAEGNKITLWNMVKERAVARTTNGTNVGWIGWKADQNDEMSSTKMAELVLVTQKRSFFNQKKPKEWTAKFTEFHKCFAQLLVTRARRVEDELFEKLIDENAFVVKLSTAERIFNQLSRLRSSFTNDPTSSTKLFYLTLERLSDASLIHWLPPRHSDFSAEVQTGWVFLDYERFLQLLHLPTRTASAMVMSWMAGAEDFSRADAMAAARRLATMGRVKMDLLTKCFPEWNKLHNLSQEKAAMVWTLERMGVAYALKDRFTAELELFFPHFLSDDPVVPGVLEDQVLSSHVVTVWCFEDRPQDLFARLIVVLCADEDIDIIGRSRLYIARVSQGNARLWLDWEAGMGELRLRITARAFLEATKISMYFSSIINAFVDEIFLPHAEEDGRIKRFFQHPLNEMLRVEVDNVIQAQANGLSKIDGDNHEFLIDQLLPAYEPPEDTIQSRTHETVVGLQRYAPGLPNIFFLSHVQTEASRTAGLIYTQLQRRCWMDKTRLVADWPRMKQGIEESRAFMLILTKTSLSSAFVRGEIFWAVKCRKPIFVAAETAQPFARHQLDSPRDRERVIPKAHPRDLPEVVEALPLPDYRFEFFKKLVVTFDAHPLPENPDLVEQLLKRYLVEYIQNEKRLLEIQKTVSELADMFNILE